MRLYTKLKNFFWYRVTQYIYSRSFASIGKHTTIYSPRQIDNASSIYIAEKVAIKDGAWLMGNVEQKKTLSIEAGTAIGHFAHIIALHDVVIGKDVLIADKVFISDCTHRYEDIDIPIIHQGVDMLNSVYIGDGSWIGENVCIQGCKIGKHCVIGSNSVVTKDIPDYSVAVGVPAKVVKKYNFEKKTWEKVE